MVTISGVIIPGIPPFSDPSGEWDERTWRNQLESTGEMIFLSEDQWRSSTVLYPYIFNIKSHMGEMIMESSPRPGPDNLTTRSRLTTWCLQNGAWWNWWVWRPMPSRFATGAAEGRSPQNHPNPLFPLLALFWMECISDGNVAEQITNLSSVLRTLLWPSRCGKSLHREFCLQKIQFWIASATETRTVLLLASSCWSME